MAKFREHRGGFKESLKTEIVVESLKDIEEYFNKQENIFNRVRNLRCEYYAMDERPGGYRETYMVTAELEGMDGRYPLGFSNRLLK